MRECVRVNSRCPRQLAAGGGHAGGSLASSPPLTPRSRLPLTLLPGLVGDIPAASLSMETGRLTEGLAPALLNAVS